MTPNFLNLIKRLAVLALVALPLLASWFYLGYTELPKRVTIATGPALGEWQRISSHLKNALEKQLKLPVDTYEEHTQGSLQHLQLLQEGDVDFALYLGGSLGDISLFSDNSHDVDTDNVAFVASIASNVVLFVVSKEAFSSGQIREPQDFRKKPEDAPRWLVAVGTKGSGEHQINRIVLNHYGISRETVDFQHLSYSGIEAAFKAGKLDAALITTSFQAPIVGRLLYSGCCTLVGIPETAAISMRNAALFRQTIPSGLYRSGSVPIPESEITTVATRTQLLTRADAPTPLVEEVTSVILSKPFLRSAHLTELDVGEVEFARQTPAFPVHPGAQLAYQPHLKPLVNPDFIASTRNLWSFLLSMLIASIAFYRWMKNRLDREKEHRLDTYFAQLLEIDAEQSRIVEDQESEHALQSAQDKLTALMQEALGEFTAHEMAEEAGVDSLLSMCHAVSERIANKLLRIRLEQSFRELHSALNNR